jgi:hypothetical protein
MNKVGGKQEKQKLCKTEIQDNKSKTKTQNIYQKHRKHKISKQKYERQGKATFMPPVCVRIL